MALTTFLRLDGVARRIGGRTLFQDVSLELRSGDRVGLVGPNGAGKTTLLRLMAGHEEVDEGRINRTRSSSVGLLRQEIDPGSKQSVREEAATALAHLDRLESELRQAEATMQAAGTVDPALADRYDAISTRFESGGGFSREARIDEVLGGLGFAEEKRDRPLRTFSGGWIMRVELAKLVLAAPDVLLLDEPTNHLDLPSIQWFEETLADFQGALVVVSHDRSFLRRNVRRIIELDGGGRFTLYQAGYDRYLSMREERRAQLVARKAKQDREIEHMERFVERFRAKATKARQAQSRVKALQKIERIELAPTQARGMRFRIPEPPRAGEVVLRLDGVHKAFGETRVYTGIDLVVTRGERIALAGPNGAGKSTLLRIAAGVLKPDRGECAPGHNVQCAYYAQHQLESLDSSRSVLEELASVAQTDDFPRLRSHLGAFLFPNDDVKKRVSVLSGGEKARLALAKMLLRPANFLVLDEPTNHLDIQSCEMLEQALAAYQGTLLFVSHDRDFINALATRVIDVTAGTLNTHLGDYDSYLSQMRPEREEPAAASKAPPAPDVAAPKQKAKVPKAKRLAQRERARTRSKRSAKLGRLRSATEAQIESDERALEALSWQLGDPEVYRDGERMRALEAQRLEFEDAIARGYAEWERIESELAALDSVREETPDRPEG